MMFRPFQINVCLLTPVALLGPQEPLPVHATVIRVAAWNMANNSDDADAEVASAPAAQTDRVASR